MRYSIIGTTMQALTIDLDAGEEVYSQTSNMAWMSPSLRMVTNLSGGFFAGLKRSLAGGGLFITDFSTVTGGQVAFAPRFPGTIVARRLAAQESLICRKESFLCAEKSIALTISWRRKFGAGIFGGEGFILQKVTGPGTVWLDLSGEVVERDLARGERLLVHVGHVGVMEATIGFDIQIVRGFRNILFGGNGLFLASLTGPGRVLLQTMPIINLAEEIARFLPKGAKGAEGFRGGANAQAAFTGGMASLLISTLGSLFRGSNRSGRA